MVVDFQEWARCCKRWFIMKRPKYINGQGKSSLVEQKWTQNKKKERSNARNKCKKWIWKWEKISWWIYISELICMSVSGLWYKCINACYCYCCYKINHKSSQFTIFPHTPICKQFIIRWKCSPHHRVLSLIPSLFNLIRPLLYVNALRSSFQGC